MYDSICIAGATGSASGAAGGTALRSRPCGLYTGYCGCARSAVGFTGLTFTNGSPSQHTAYLLYSAISTHKTHCTGTQSVT
jgi:hypothetical protein